MRSATHILVHGKRYRDQLVRRRDLMCRVTCTPLLHLFAAGDALDPDSPECEVSYDGWALFFGRIEPYKGVDYLVTACDMLNGTSQPGPKVVIAGAGKLDKLWAGPMPQRLELRNRRIHDEEALALFRRCSLVVLPYIEASQSALIAAAYYFRKPVLVTRTGALPEYVEEGRTGSIVEPGHAIGLARTLERMLSDQPGLQRMGNAGRLWYEARRREETAIMFRLYNDLAGGRQELREEW